MLIVGSFLPVQFDAMARIGGLASLRQLAAMMLTASWVLDYVVSVVDMKWPPRIVKSRFKARPVPQA